MIVTSHIMGTGLEERRKNSNVLDLHIPSARVHRKGLELVGMGLDGFCLVVFSRPRDATTPHRRCGRASCQPTAPATPARGPQVNPTQDSWGCSVRHSLSCSDRRAVTPESAGRRGGLLIQHGAEWLHTYAGCCFHACSKNSNIRVS